MEAARRRDDVRQEASAVDGMKIGGGSIRGAAIAA
jgi:hypothetical protein